MWLPASWGFRKNKTKQKQEKQKLKLPRRARRAKAAQCGDRCQPMTASLWPPLWPTTLGFRLGCGPSCLAVTTAAPCCRRAFRGNAADADPTTVARLY